MHAVWLYLSINQMLGISDNPNINNALKAIICYSGGRFLQINPYIKWSKESLMLAGRIFIVNGLT